MKKRKEQINLLTILLFILAAACQPYKKRDFFQEVANRKITLGDSTISFIKDFQISDKGTTIFGKKYWKISSEIDQFFHINGYLRKQDNKIILLPFPDQVKGEQKEFVWLDFDATENQNWQYITSKILTGHGDSVIYKGKSVLDGDTLYNFLLYPFKYYDANQSKYYEAYHFNILVSKTKGIKTIQTNTSDIQLYEANLYPKLQFVDKQKGAKFL